MFDISRLFDFGYLLHPNPGKFFPTGTWLLLFFALLVLVAVAIFVTMRSVKLNPVLKRILRKIPTRLFSFGIVGTVLILLRLGEAAYLSMRVWLVLWGIGFAYYVVTVIRQFQTYSRDVEEFNRKLAAKGEKVKQWEMMGKKRK